jgi:hypothetical protein
VELRKPLVLSGNVQLELAAGVTLTLGAQPALPNKQVGQAVAEDGWSVAAAEQAAAAVTAHTP